MKTIINEMKTTLDEEKDQLSNLVYKVVENKKGERSTQVNQEQPSFVK